MTGLWRTTVKLVLFVVVVALMGVLLVNTMRHAVGGPSRSFTAVFTDVDGLRPGDDVRVAGVRVGRVDSIEANQDAADVRFDLVDSQPIYDSTVVVMRYQNLVGQRYLELVARGGGAALAPGATIDQGHTNPGFDLTELLNGFRPLFSVLQPAQVNKLSGSIIAVLQGEGGTVTDLLHQTASLTNFLADRDRIYGKVLVHLTPVLHDLAGQGDGLRSTVVELERLMTGLARNRHSIGASIDGVSRLIGSTSSLLRQVRRPGLKALHQFLRTAGVLAGSKADLARAIASFRQSLGSLGRSTSYENALNFYACKLYLGIGDQRFAPFGTQGPYSKVCR